MRDGSARRVDRVSDMLRRFLDATSEMPWRWTPAHVEEYFGALRAVKHLKQSTVRGYQNALQLFCAYVVDPAYGWGTRRGELFGTHPSERGTLVSETALSSRFCRYRDELGLDRALDMHSFRRSYATDLIEAGFDPPFVQKQLGHEHASTTAIYAFVSHDYRRTMLRNALDTTIGEALNRRTR